MSLVDYAASSSDEDETHSPSNQQTEQAASEEKRQRFEAPIPSSSSPVENPTSEIHAPAPHNRNLANRSKQVEIVPNQSSELKLPDASTLFNSPAVPSSLPNALDHSSRVAMAESTARKRELNGSSNYTRSSKVPKGAVPHTKNVPDTVGGKLLPPQLAGRSNVVTEDISKLFVRNRTNSSTE